MGQLKGKAVPGAIDNGVSRDELRAIAHVIGVYCGVPQVLEERDML